MRGRGGVGSCRTRVTAWNGWGSIEHLITYRMEWTKDAPDDFRFLPLGPGARFLSCSGSIFRSLHASNRSVTIGPDLFARFANSCALSNKPFTSVQKVEDTARKYERQDENVRTFDDLCLHPIQRARVGSIEACIFQPNEDQPLNCLGCHLGIDRRIIRRGRGFRRAGRTRV